MLDCIQFLSSNLIFDPKIFSPYFIKTHFSSLLRPLALWFCKIGRNHSVFMNEYLKENLNLGDSLENFFVWITLATAIEETKGKKDWFIYALSCHTLWLHSMLGHPVVPFSVRFVFGFELAVPSWKWSCFLCRLKSTKKSEQRKRD